MFPGKEGFEAVRWEELQIDQEFKDVCAEDFLQWFDGEFWQGMENAVAGEESIGNERMEMGMEIEVFGKALAGDVAELLEQGAVALEIAAQHLGNGQDVMAMRDRGEDAGGEQGGGGLNGFLLAGWAEAAAFAGEGEQEIVLTVVAMDPGEPALEIAAVVEFVDDLRDDWPDWAHEGLVLRGVEIEELGEVAIDALPQGRFARVEGAVEFHLCQRDRSTTIRIPFSDN